MLFLCRFRAETYIFELENPDSFVQVGSLVSTKLCYIVKVANSTKIVFLEHRKAFYGMWATGRLICGAIYGSGSKIFWLKANYFN